MSADQQTLRIMVIGDVVDDIGLDALCDALPSLRATHSPHAIIVNAENTADGAGTRAAHATRLLDAGVDVLTGGNHSLRQRDFMAVLESNARVLRPENIAVRAPGRGLTVVDVSPGYRVAVINVMGSVFMDVAQSPWAVIDALVQRARRETHHIVVDVHAEATSEKVALGWHLDGAVTAVVGTHTHVQTADARVLPDGTAYITDLGMTGPHDGVIGVRKEIILRRFTTGSSGRFVTAEGDVRIHGALIEAGPDGRATAIAPFSVSG